MTNNMAFGDIDHIWQNITTIQQFTIDWYTSAQTYINLTSGEASGVNDIIDGYGTGTIDGESTTRINNITSDVPYEDYKYRPETYMVPIMFGIIFIVGVVGNGTLIIVFIRHRAMRNVPNTYILSLALADMLLIVTSVPFVSLVYTLESWPWGSTICTMSEFIKDVSVGVSVFTLTVLSSDRFFAIVDPLRKFQAHGGTGKRATVMTIMTAGFIWLLAVMCGIPALVGSNVKHLQINKNTSFKFCYPFPDEWGPEYAKAIVLAKFLVYYAIPLIIIGLFYVMIARHLIYTASVPGEIQGALRQVKARKKVAVTVLTFVVIFGVCFLPQHIFMLWFYYSKNSNEGYNLFWHILRIIGFCLSFGNSCANPVALYCVSGAFRKHFNRYLLCKGSSKSSRKRQRLSRRDMSLTSTISRRYPSGRLCHQGTLRSAIQSFFSSTNKANVKVLKLLNFFKYAKEERNSRTQ